MRELFQMRKKDKTCERFSKRQTHEKPYTIETWLISFKRVCKTVRETEADGKTESNTLRAILLP